MSIPKTFITDTLERCGKTFLQFYFGSWFLMAKAAVTYNTLFTATNVKAGVVGVALSFATSLGTKIVNKTDSSASLLE